MYIIEYGQNYDEYYGNNPDNPDNPDNPGSYGYADEDADESAFIEDRHDRSDREGSRAAELSPPDDLRDNPDNPGYTLENILADDYHSPTRPVNVKHSETEGSEHTKRSKNRLIRPRGGSTGSPHPSTQSPQSLQSLEPSAAQSSSVHPSSSSSSSSQPFATLTPPGPNNPSRAGPETTTPRGG